MIGRKMMGKGRPGNIMTLTFLFRGNTSLGTCLNIICLMLTKLKTYTDSEYFDRALISCPSLTLKPLIPLRGANARSLRLLI
jgi:hypothetical protein